MRKLKSLICRFLAVSSMVFLCRIVTMSYRSLPSLSRPSCCSRIASPQLEPSQSVASLWLFAVRRAHGLHAHILFVNVLIPFAWLCADCLLASSVNQGMVLPSGSDRLQSTKPSRLEAFQNDATIWKICYRRGCLYRYPCWRQ